MGIPVICRKENYYQSSKNNYQIILKKLMASFKEALSKVILNLFLFSVHVVPNFVTAINYFVPSLKENICIVGAKVTSCY